MNFDDNDDDDANNYNNNNNNNLYIKIGSVCLCRGLSEH